MNAIKIHLLTFLLLSFCLFAHADEVTINGIKYNIITKGDVATVIAGDAKYKGNIVIPNEVTYNDKAYTVTAIGSEAFRECTGLTSIELPNTITTIGYNSFYKTAIKSIKIPNSVTTIESRAFFECRGLTKVEIPNNVTKIGDYAFCWCYGLTSITIGSSVTSIGYEAFGSCNKLTSITIPNNVTNLGEYAFEDCTALKSIVLSNSIKTIKSYTFSGCSMLSDIKIPSSVTNIEAGAFSGCTSIVNIEIPNSVSKIGSSFGSGTFSGCSNLEKIVIGNNVKNIDGYVFSGCDKLTEIYCYALEVPNAQSKIFYQAYPEFITLYVPEESIQKYIATEPWNTIGEIKTLTNSGNEIKKCAIPIINYNNGKLDITCETDNAEFITEITCNDINKFFSNTIELTATYNIATYATLSGYENSDVATATLCWLGDFSNNSNVTKIESSPILVSNCENQIIIKGVKENIRVDIYRVDGTKVAYAISNNSEITISTTLDRHEIAIVNIGNTSIKYIMK